MRDALLRALVEPPRFLSEVARAAALATLIQLARAGDSLSARELARLASHPAVGPRVLQALASVGHPASIDAICAVWVGSRHPGLEEVIRQAGWAAGGPVAARVLTHLLQDRLAAVWLGGDSWGPALLLACGDPNPRIAAAALRCLERLPLGSPRLHVAEAVLESSLLPEVALQALVRLGYAPEALVPRALFFLVTGQLARYDDLDYDQSILRAAFGELPDPLRLRVVARVRESGWAELAVALQAEQPRRRLHGLTPAEYETVVSILENAGRLEDLWSMAFRSLPEGSSEILGILERRGFEPGPEDAAMYRRLLAGRPREGRDMRLQLPELTRNAVVKSHPSAVRGLAFSPDGKILAVGAAHPDVFLWDPYRGKQLGTLTGHRGLVSALAFSPDGRLLVTAGGDGGAFLWDALRQRRLREILPEEAPSGLLLASFSPSGRYLAMGGWHSILLVLDLERDRMLLFEGHEACVVACAFSPDERFLASASWDKTARLWSLASGRPHKTLKGHSERLMDVAFDRDGENVVTVGLDGRVLWWSADTGIRAEGGGFHSAPVWRMAVHPDGRLVATSGADGAIRFWIRDSIGPRPLTGHSGRTTALGFSPRGDYLARTSTNCTTMVWHAGDVLSDLNTATTKTAANSLAFAPDSRTLATRHDSGEVTFWSLFQTKPLATMDQEDLARLEKWATGMPAGPERRKWEWVADLARCKFRHEIQLGQAGDALFDQFAIDVE